MSTTVKFALQIFFRYNMRMKKITCIQCHKKKKPEKFREGRSTCRKCSRQYDFDRRHAKHGLVQQIYQNQKTNSQRRGHQPPTYSFDELYEWIMAQEIFHVLYDNWKRLDYQKDYAPSIDRKDDSIGYTMDNIQLMTFRENYMKQCKKASNAVAQYTKQGELVDIFESAEEASRQTGAVAHHILSVCRKKPNRRSAGGYTWEFYND